MSRLAHSATLSGSDGRIYIDGQEFPFYVGEDIDVTGLGRDEITTLVLPVLIDGVVIIDDRRGRKVIDGALLEGLGDVGEYARALVRQELHKAFPWLAQADVPF